MNTQNYLYMIDRICEQDDEGKLNMDPGFVGVRNAREEQRINPVKLKANLLASGYVIIDDDKEHEMLGYRKFGNLMRLLVNDAKGNLVAMGAASDYNEALLAAMLGYLREH